MICKKQRDSLFALLAIQKITSDKKRCRRNLRKYKLEFLKEVRMYNAAMRDFRRITGINKNA